MDIAPSWPVQTRLTRKGSDLVDTGQWNQLFTPANPAAGSTFTRLIPGETFERIIHVRATLTASAAAGNRTPFLVILNGDGTEVTRAESALVLAPSATGIVTWGAELDTNSDASTNIATGPRPDGIWPSGFSIGIRWLNIDAADQLLGLSLYMERYPTGPMAYPGGARAFDPAMWV